MGPFAVIPEKLALAGLTTALLLASCASARAQDTAPPPAFDVSASAGVVSDYRFRGVSLSNRDPAAQAGVAVRHQSGFFAGTWASSIADQGAGNVEVDLYGGFGGVTGQIEYNVTALAYVYPGGGGQDYYELSGSADLVLGPASVGLTAAWVPSQSNYGGDNVYVGAKAKLPFVGPRTNLFGHVGYEDGSTYQGRGKWDWELGASYVAGPVTASLSYVDTNYSGPNQYGRLARAAIVASLVANF
jgi:uncharacterized protein (TIGR02001 family)